MKNPTQTPSIWDEFKQWRRKRDFHESEVAKHNYPISADAEESHQEILEKIRAYLGDSSFERKVLCNPFITRNTPQLAVGIKPKQKY